MLTEIMAAQCSFNLQVCQCLFCVESSLQKVELFIINIYEKNTIDFNIQEQLFLQNHGKLWYFLFLGVSEAVQGTD